MCKILYTRLEDGDGVTTLEPWKEQIMTIAAVLNHDVFSEVAEIFPGTRQGATSKGSIQEAGKFPKKLASDGSRFFAGGGL